MRSTTLPRSKCHASLYGPYLAFFSCGYNAMLPCPLNLSAGMMYHMSTGIRYAARKSNGSPSYGPRQPRTVHE